MHFENTRIWIVPLGRAMGNVHHDESGFRERSDG